MMHGVTIASCERRLEVETHDEVLEATLLLEYRELVKYSLVGVEHCNGLSIVDCRDMDGENPISTLSSVGITSTQFFSFFFSVISCVRSLLLDFFNFL